ncbi:MAG: preprotein translocase subunit YajC [Actinomycetes bacterium]
MDPVSLLLIVAAGAGFYFLIIRPGQQRQKRQAQMVQQLVPGTEVMTTAGIFGTIAVVTEDQLSLEIAPGVFMRILPAAVARVIEPAAAEAPPLQESEGTGDVD